MKDIKVKDKELKAWLTSGESTSILKGLELVRKNGKSEHVPLIVNIALNHTDEKVAEEALSLLRDNKNSAAHVLIYEEVRNHRNHESVSKLLSVLWEAGIDVNEHLQELVEIAVASNYQSLVELFSIIDNDEDGFEYEMVTEVNLLLNEQIEEDPESDRSAMLHTIALMLSEKIIN